jgi:hypothetical protein
VICLARPGKWPKRHVALMGSPRPASPLTSESSSKFIQCKVHLATQPLHTVVQVVVSLDHTQRFHTSHSAQQSRRVLNLLR